MQNFIYYWCELKHIAYPKVGGVKPCKTYHSHGFLGYSVHFCICTLAFAFLALFCVASAFAQERFTVQSSARGMENAKQAAQIRQLQVRDGQQDSRLDAVEGDIEQLAPHVWKSLGQCGVGAGAGGVGYKITWNPAGSGTWGCIQETDPTVKAFAKTDLPACGAGQVLRSNGTQFLCTTSSGTSGFEVDPYVQDFARNTAYTINACAADEVLTMTSKRLRCVKSRDLSVTETDPTVQPFAKAALPNCAAGQVLTTAVGTGGVTVLRCVTDTDGGYAELDPSVGTITNNRWCMASGGKIHCNQNPPVLTEADPKVGALTDARWCRASGGKVVCDQAAPAGDNLGNHTATQNINMNGKWLSGDGDSEGIKIDGAGNVRIGNTASGSHTIRGLIEIHTNVSTQPDILLNQSGSIAAGGKLHLLSSGDGGTTGYISFGSGGFTPSESTELMRIVASNGRVGIGTSSPSQQLHVAGNGLFTGTMTATAYYASSDRNLKRNITPISDPFALLDGIEGKRYIWKKSRKPAYGIIAQDVEKVMPEAVRTIENGTKTVEYSQLIAPMLEAIKQLESRVRELERNEP